MITLDFGGGDVVELPADLAWADYLMTSGWAQAQERTLTGALLVETVANEAPPITLTSGTTYGWADTTLVEALRSRFEGSVAPLTLTIGEDSYTVLLDLEAGGLDVQPRKARPAEVRPAADWWAITLHFRRLAVL